MDVGTVRHTSARASSTVLSSMLGSPAMVLGKGWYVRAARAIASFIPPHNYWYATDLLGINGSAEGVALRDLTSLDFLQPCACNQAEE